MSRLVLVVELFDGFAHVVPVVPVGERAGAPVGAAFTAARADSSEAVVWPQLRTGVDLRP